MNKKGDRIHPCLTPDTISKNSVAQPAVFTQQPDDLYSALKVLFLAFGVRLISLDLFHFPFVDKITCSVHERPPIFIGTPPTSEYRFCTVFYTIVEKLPWLLN